MTPDAKQQASIDRYNAYLAKRPDATRYQIYKATGMAHSTQIKYAEYGWIKLVPVLDKKEQIRRTKANWNMQIRK